MRSISKVAPHWWDYTTLDEKILKDAAKLTSQDLLEMSREGFKVSIYDSREEFFAAEAMEYITSWSMATESEPAGICGPIGPTEQLPIVARMVNDLGVNLKNAHFWGMDEWYNEGEAVSPSNPLSFAKADMDLCFSRIAENLKMPAENIHFLNSNNISEYTSSFDSVKCMVMQGGQGEVKHWAFNDPPKREGIYKDSPPSPEEYRKLSARVVELHPMTIIQNARTSGGGAVSNIPIKALTVGPVETWKSEKVSIWHPGWHDNPFGIRLTTLMISKHIADSSVPMSLLGDHPNVHFHLLRSGIGTCEPEMH